MPRIRSIHPDACDSEKLSSLSDSAERTFFRLLTHTDDEGRGEDRPKLLAAKLYPLHDGKDADSVNSDLDELQHIGLLTRYGANGKRYYAIPTFRDWQNPRHPTASKLPSPDDADPEPDSSSTDKRESVTAKRRKTPAGVGVGGGVGGGEGDEEQTLSPAEPPKRTRAAQLSDSWTPDDVTTRALKQKYPKLNLDDQLERFRDHAKTNGRTAKDWTAAWRNWVRKANEMAQSRGSPSPPSIADQWSGVDEVEL